MVFLLGATLPLCPLWIRPCIIPEKTRKSLLSVIPKMKMHEVRIDRQTYRCKYQVFVTTILTISWLESFIYVISTFHSGI